MSEGDLPLTVVPGDHEHLNSLVVDTVSARWGAPPIEREHGVYAMRFPKIAVEITTDFDPPLIEVAGTLVTGLADQDAALHDANIMNGAFPALKFVVIDDELTVRTIVQAMPLVPDHLFVALSLITDLANDLGPDIVDRFGGNAPH